MWLVFEVEVWDTTINCQAQNEIKWNEIQKCAFL